MQPSTTPPESPPSLAPFLDYANCIPPTRKIFTEQDIPNWTNSQAFSDIETIIQRLSYAVDGKTIEDPCQESEVTKGIVLFLNKMASWIDEIPLQTTPQRFGNKAFRDWIAVMDENEEDFQKSILTPEQYPVLPELSYQFRSSFGSGPRLDYGTGHELSFLAYLLILRRIGTLKEEDEQAVVTRVFVAYLDVVRKLQKVYKLEPAGSKGVWGLDDHQHLVYLWGASQLRTHPTLRPASILSPRSVSPHGISYLFLSSILHINDLKTGPFAEHSPLLHNIASTVPTWSKVNSGLTKMYKEEVLKKAPVVQHFRFGSVLAWKDIVTGEVLPSSGDGLEGAALEEEQETELLRVRDDAVVAPWKLPNLSGTSGPVVGGGLPFQRQGNSPTTTSYPSLSAASATTSSSSSSSSSSGANTPHSNAEPTLVPQPFVPPTLFPMHRRASLLRHSISSSDVVDDAATEGNSLKDQGGAAAATSPFGVLDSATKGFKELEEKRVPWEKEKEGE